jgi:hypothetical protein
MAGRGGGGACCRSFYSLAEKAPSLDGRGQVARTIPHGRCTCAYDLGLAILRQKLACSRQPAHSAPSGAS